MCNVEDRITRLEEHSAHQSALVDDLNVVVTKQRDEIDQLARRVEMLMLRAAEQEASQMAGEPIGDQKPPHW